MAVITVIQRKCDTHLWHYVQRKNLRIHLRAFIAFMPHIGLDDLRRHVIEKQMNGKTVTQRLWIDIRERKYNLPFPAVFLLTAPKGRRRPVLNVARWRRN